MIEIRMMLLIQLLNESSNLAESIECLPEGLALEGEKLMRASLELCEFAMVHGESTLLDKINVLGARAVRLRKNLYAIL